MVRSHFLCSTQAFTASHRAPSLRTLPTPSFTTPALATPPATTALASMKYGENHYRNYGVHHHSNNMSLDLTEFTNKSWGLHWFHQEKPGTSLVHQTVWNTLISPRNAARSHWCTRTHRCTQLDDPWTLQWCWTWLTCGIMTILSDHCQNMFYHPDHFGITMMLITR